MVRPERRVVLTGAKSCPDKRRAPGSRLQPGGEIFSSRAELSKALEREEQTAGPQQSVNAIAASKFSAERCCGRQSLPGHRRRSGWKNLLKKLAQAEVVGSTMPTVESQNGNSG
jgi:hypothetical protein